MLKEIFFVHTFVLLMIYYTFDDNFKGYENVVTNYVCRTKATL